MIKNILFTLCVFFTLWLWGQKTPQQYFEEATAWHLLSWDSVQCNTAYKNFEYIIQNYPNTNLYIPSVYHTIPTLVKKEHDQKAIQRCHELLKFQSSTPQIRIIATGDTTKVYQKKISHHASKIVEIPISYNTIKIDVARIKHVASYHLYKLYKKREKYDSALYYLELSEKYHVNETPICGTAIKSEIAIHAVEKSKLYFNIGQQKKAVEELLSIVFMSDWHLEPREVIPTLKTLFLQEKKSHKLIKQLNKSLNNIKKEKVINNKIQYYVIFQNYKFVLGQYPTNKTLDKTYFLNKLKFTSFNKMLEELAIQKHK